MMKNSTSALLSQNHLLPEVPLVSPHAFAYKWTLADANFTKDKGKVFSCFSCGGGSTMGYKLAGFDVIGCNEIDPKMMAAYKANHNPKYAYLEPIQTFKLRNDLPGELYQLDILDGSPPCSSFSMAGNREKDWGKDKVFREGQAEQVLDTLFFDFIELAEKLQPKIVIAENVKGLLMGEAREYVRNIYKAFDKAGYYCQHWLLDASKMGVPQRRERMFFVALRKDLAAPFLYQKDMFQQVPKLELNFNEPKINFGDLGTMTDNHQDKKTVQTAHKYWTDCKKGDSFSTVSGGSFFNWCRLNEKEVAPTMHTETRMMYHPNIMRPVNEKECKLISSFPMDYDFTETNYSIFVGMSVPPIMTAQIAKKIYEQWLSKL